MSYSENAAQAFVVIIFCCCSSFHPSAKRVAAYFLVQATEMQQIFMATREGVEKIEIYVYICVREIETWKAKLWPRGSGLIRPGQGSIYRAGQLYPIGSGRCRSLKKSIECPVLQLHLQLSPSLGIIGHGSAGFLLNQSSSTCSAALARSQRMWLQIYSSFCFQLF